MRAGVLLLVAALLPSCVIKVRSELGHFYLTDSYITRSCPVVEVGRRSYETGPLRPAWNTWATGVMSAGTPVLEETALYLALTHRLVFATEPGDAEPRLTDLASSNDWLHCYDLAPLGDMVGEWGPAQSGLESSGYVSKSGIWMFGGGGGGGWDLIPTDCPGYPAEFRQADRLQIDVLSPAEVEGAMVPWFERQSEKIVLDAASQLPEDWGEPLSRRLQVVEDEVVTVDVGLLGPQGRTVAFNTEDAEVTLNAVRGSFEVLGDHDARWCDGEVGWPQPQHLSVRLARDSEVEVRLRVGSESWEAGRLVAVPESHVDGWELVLVPLERRRGLDGSWLDEVEPRARYAAVRAWDEDGEAVVGAPVNWGFRGDRIAIRSWDRFENRPWLVDAGTAELTYDCELPSMRAGPRTADVVARYRGRRESVEVSWDFGPEPASMDDEGFLPPAECFEAELGCGCSVGAESNAAIYLLLPLPLLAARRRGRGNQVGADG